MPGLLKKDDGKGLPTLVSELWQLVVTYVKQETIGSLKALVPFLKWGVIGATLLAIGVPLLALALLRGAQTADAFDGHLSFVPYVIVLVALGVAMFLLGRQISKKESL